MHLGNDFLNIVTVILGSAGICSIIIKAMNRNIDKATAAQITAASRSDSDRNEFEIIRGVLEEVRISDKDKTAELAVYRAQLDTVQGRLDSLEERERHMLLRAAVHEAWDQMSFMQLIKLNPQHPPPPPLINSSEDTNNDNFESAGGPED